MVLDRQPALARADAVLHAVGLPPVGENAKDEALHLSVLDALLLRRRKGGVDDAFGYLDGLRYRTNPES